ncbi:MAG: response regulator [Candidatus Enteromonas sp.]|nr:response regulator [Candidatus Enteromonas sp.]
MKAISDLTVGNAPTIVEQIPTMRLDEQKEWDKEYYHAETKEIRWFHITAFFNRIEGEGKFILVLSDRTQTKLINQALEEALVNAQSASKAKSTFLSNMSHDIRTPMNAIIGFANLAGASVNDPKKTQDYLAKIQDSSNHLLAIINDVLDMSRIEAGKLAMERNEVYFPEVLRELRVIIGGQVKAKGLNLYMDTSTIEHEYVYCDKTRLNQMLMNLLSNAVKFTPSGGSISVSIAEEASNQPQTAIYHIRVKDDGIGMSEEFAARIFDPFERERTSTVSRTQGTGLGMSIVKNIVTLMGGTIEVSTHPGEGSEFHITVALELQNVEKPDETIESLKGLKAITIHENPGSRQSAIAILRRLGMSPIAVASLQEGLELMEKAEEKGNPFTIALVNGDQKNEDAYSYWKKFSRLPSLKALIVGAYESADIEKKAKEAGVSFIIPKPLFLSELQSALLDFLGERPTAEDIPQAKDLTMFRGKRLLLVEDNELNREIALATLEGYGFSFLTAENGKEAIEIVASSRPGEIDLILMDVQMPIMDGYEATERIRNLKDPVLSNTPIIAMTANAFAEDRQKAENAGMNGFLTKPIEVDKVIDLLTTILYRS